MPDIESLLTRWQSAGVLDAETASRIRAHEAQSAGGTSSGLRWQGITALILGAILLACGVVLFVSAHWDQLGPGARFTLVIAMVAVFHIAGGFARSNYRALSSALHAVGTISTGAAIALVGQIFNIQEHWPAAILLWALAALFGWALLHDQAQQTLALLLVPAWMFSEISFYTNDHIGDNVFEGRFLFLWAVLYITFFIASRRRAVQGILFAAACVALLYGTAFMSWGWNSWPNELAVPFGVSVLLWTAIAVLPLLIAAFHGHKGLIPIAAAIVYSIALPWCYRPYTDHFRNETISGYRPNLLAYALLAAFAVFLCWWGVRLASRALVNLGVVGFAATVGWFYSSDIMSEVNRSLGLIGLGVLFFAGGWALEKMRRRMLARMASAGAASQIAAADANGGAQ
jgi:uncharacterized membrane protein